jgi:hypothetical protein
VSANEGEEFQRATKYARRKLGDGHLEWHQKPLAYKNCPNSTKIKLPIHKQIVTMSLNEAIRRCRSIRAFSHKPLTLEQLSYLLWASSGIQEKDEGYEFRISPSAGALYPIETYLIVNNIDGLKGSVSLLDKIAYV